MIRSDNLSKLTPADQRKLAGLGLATVVDLRTDIERALQPDRPVPGARHYDANVFGQAAANAFDLPAAYRMFVSDPMRAPSSPERCAWCRRLSRRAARCCSTAPPVRTGPAGRRRCC